jgi:hypothetical protein
VTGFDPPTPPVTGSNGSGVTIRLAMPTRNSAQARDEVNTAKRSTTKRIRFTCSTLFLIGEVTSLKVSGIFNLELDGILQGA